MNLTFSRLFILILSTFCCTTFLNSAPSKDTDYQISGGGQVNFNNNNASFSSLPGLTSCCNQFQGGSGIGAGFFAGIDYRSNYLQDFFKKSKVNLKLTYSNLSTEFTRSEFAGNVISGNTVQQGMVQHTLTPKLNLIGAEIGTTIYPVDAIPASIYVGLNAGYLFGHSFSYQEQLLSPDNVTFENGLRVRALQSGSLTGANSLLFAFSFGLKYDLLRINNIVIAPQLTYNLGISSVVQSVNWKVNTLSIGIAINYILQEPKRPDPIPPPMLNPEPPRHIVKPEVAINLFVDNIKLNPGDTIFIPVLSTVQRQIFTIIPKIFFQKNSADLYSPQTTFPLDQYDAQNFVMVAAIEYMLVHNDVNLHLKFSSSPDEDSTMVKLRIENIINQFSSAGIDKSRIMSNIINNSGNHLYDVLQDEFRYVEFAFTDNTKALDIIKDTLINATVKPSALLLIPEIANTNTKVNIRGEVFVGNQKIKDFAETQIILPIDNTFINNKELRINAKLYYTGLNDEINETKYNLKTKPEQENILENIIQSSDSPTQYQEYFLGYFDFDGTSFTGYNQQVINTVREAAQNGKKIEILPLTDNIGIEAHNSQLARLRANSALQILNLNLSDTQITIPRNYLYNNDTPIGRTLNRSVVIRIY